jgi:hypothetical protein
MSALKSIPSNATSQAGCSPCTPATHQEAADVSAALAAGEILGLGNTPFMYLPLYARVAVERLDRDDSLRTGAQLDELLKAYAESMAHTVDLETCAAAHRVCSKRFYNFAETVQGAPWVVHH